MESPAQRLLNADLADIGFRVGVASGRWNAFSTEGANTWPMRFFWLAAAQRTGAPDRYHIRLDMTGYRDVGPTGRFWDPTTGQDLSLANYPKGKAGSRFAMVFRTDSWAEGHKAFYHPYDRVALQGHSDWPKTMPHLVWGPALTIADYLDEFQNLLTSGDYVGL